MHEIENEEIIQYDKFDQKIILHSSEMDILLSYRESCFTKHVLVQGWQSHSTLMLGSSTFTALLSLEERALEKKNLSKRGKYYVEMCSNDKKHTQDSGSPSSK